MGRPFLEHMGGKLFYSCQHCNTYLSSKKEVLADTFQGATGPAFLFKNVFNINYSKVESRNMLTGVHLVRDVFCKNCLNKLGWMYEFAFSQEQRYKEGNVILECKLLREYKENNQNLALTNRSLTRTSSNSSMSSSGISSVTTT